MSFFTPAPPPKTALGYHRILSPLAGVRVSPLALGAMSIGDAWTDFMGSMSKEQSFKLLDEFYAAGGNFIDTANNYQDQQSEEWLGEWMETRGVRDQMVIATKYTTKYVQMTADKAHTVNYAGNSTKSLHVSLRDSLKKLRTDYVDILYLHWWDYSTKIEEIMQSLDAVVKSGKVLYLGISDTPAWVVSKANQYARDHGMAPFVIYQGLWNVMMRDFERDIIPMVQSEGMALAPWSAMGGGKFQSKKSMEERTKSGEGTRSIMGNSGQSEQEEKMSAALEKVGNEVGASVTAVALAYVLQRVPYVFPIIGGRKVEHLHDNIKALEIDLSDEQIQYLESITPYDPGFPHGFIGEDPHRKGESTGMLVKLTGNIKWVPSSRPIHPHSVEKSQK